MSPEALSSLLENWVSLLFIIFTGISTISSISVKILVSFIKNQQEFMPGYKPNRYLIFAVSLLQAIALNSPAASNMIKRK